MAQSILPCPGCGHEISPEHLKEKLIPQKTAIVLLKKKMVSDGYYATCPRSECKTKVTFEKEYVEMHFKPEKLGKKSGIIIGKK